MKMISDKELLERSINAQIKMRKITRIDLEQEKGVHNPRPNINILHVSGFGTGKSTISKWLQKIIMSGVLI